jgi:hypothetical protein
MIRMIYLLFSGWFQFHQLDYDVYEILESLNSDFHFYYGCRASLPMYAILERLNSDPKYKHYGDGVLISSLNRLEKLGYISSVRRRVSFSQRSPFFSKKPCRIKHYFVTGKSLPPLKENVGG